MKALAILLLLTSAARADQHPHHASQVYAVQLHQQMRDLDALVAATKAADAATAASIAASHLSASPK